ncbi:MAG: MATE family efflux transporter [Burkholderiales bacterium]
MSRPSAQRLLEGPILSTLTRLALPGAVLAVFQTGVSIADAFYVGHLGTVALAGLALVFPLLMLLQMTSAGAMGGGVSSALARALGAGREDDARGIVAHGVMIAAGAGLGYTALMLALGPALYRLLGGAGGSLGQALAYSNTLFAGAIGVWIANTLASVLRGSGNTLAPAVALAAAAIAQIPLSGALTLGWGPYPRLGIVGAAIAYVAAFLVASLIMGVIVWRGPLRPRRVHWRLQAPLLRDILRVGAVSSLGALQTVLTAVILTGFVGTFGTAALAGYGVGVRLELLQVPLVFAIGQALVVMVGTNIGAGRGAHAKRIAWIGTAVAASMSLAIGVVVALFPGLWIRIFSADAAVVATGSQYLHIVAPFYVLFGAGMALYFASQGAGRMTLPVLAGTARLALVAAGGAVVVASSGPLAAVFAVVACGIVLFGTLITAAVRAGRWQG